MREIKFRIWDGQCFRGNLKKYFLNLHDGQISEVAYSDLYDEYYDASERGSKLIVQQFTGLLDKNGTEIYEGDLIRFEPQDGVWSDQHNTITTVKFPFLCCNAHLGRVVGHIFENNKPLEHMNSDEIKDKLESLKHHHVYIATTDQEVYLKDALDILSEDFVDKGNLCDQTTLDLVAALKNFLK